MKHAQLWCFGVQLQAPLAGVQARFILLEMQLRCSNSVQCFAAWAGLCFQSLSSTEGLMCICGRQTCWTIHQTAPHGDRLPDMHLPGITAIAPSLRRQHSCSLGEHLQGLDLS